MFRKYSIPVGLAVTTSSGRSPWHRELLKIASLLVEAFRWVSLLFRSAQTLRTENLFLRRQLALYIERGVQRHRVDAATRFRLVVLARLFDLRDALVVVQPPTMIRWHRAGRRLLWRMKSRAGRPAIPMELRELIRRKARQNFYREPAEFTELFVGMEGQYQDAVARH